MKNGWLCSLLVLIGLGFGTGAAAQSTPNIDDFDAVFADKLARAGTGADPEALLDELDQWIAEAWAYSEWQRLQDYYHTLQASEWTPGGGAKPGSRGQRLTKNQVRAAFTDADHAAFDRFYERVLQEWAAAIAAQQAAR